MNSIMNRFSLEGKVAVVTGANTGLGQGISVALAAAGAHVFGVARRSCAETAEKVQAVGGRFSEIMADMSKLESIDTIISSVKAEAGHLDILVNNAGIIKRCDAIDVSVEDWDSVIDINLRMVYFLSQAAAREFMAQGTGGKIINICSMLSFQGGIRVPAYTASKSAVMGITRALANEWARHGININGIAPGYMATNNTAQLRQDEERSSDILARIPAGRWGTPEDVQGAAIFLASAASDYVNGYTVAVDGGWLAR